MTRDIEDIPSDDGLLERRFGFRRDTTVHMRRYLFLLYIRCLLLTLGLFCSLISLEQVQMFSGSISGDKIALIGPSAAHHNIPQPAIMFTIITRTKDVNVPTTRIQGEGRQVYSRAK
jgi:hypothetical protein